MAYLNQFDTIYHSDTDSDYIPSEHDSESESSDSIETIELIVPTHVRLKGMNAYRNKMKLLQNDSQNKEKRPVRNKKQTQFYSDT